jgi:hypothetical protein
VTILLRTIRKAKWYKHPGVLWLGTQDLQADALGDLYTESNRLSVWEIEESLSNLERILTAIAAGKDSLSNIDYALIDQQILSEINIKSEKKEGATIDIGVNSWHRDLIELSAGQIMDLAEAIHTKAKRDRVPHLILKERIREAVTSGRIDPAKLKEGLAAKVFETDPTTRAKVDVEAIRKAIADEREACAQIADKHNAEHISDEIRSRS